MTNTCAHSISASLAVLRSGGWVGVETGTRSVSIRALQATEVLGDAPVLVSNRLAMANEIAVDGDADQPSLLFGAADLGLSLDIQRGILALLKMAHVSPGCRIAVDQAPTVSITGDCLLSLTDTVYPLVFNRSVTMPTSWSKQTKLHLFSEQQDSKREHLAAICNTNDSDEPPLVRVHSKCVTGDIFNSLRCDCGEQLGTAKYMIGAEGNGILIYLDQEGRGIGLRNKLTAYELQDAGADTFLANHQLGYEADERTYEAAITILEHLGVSKIRLLTNNPDKIDQLGSKIEVVERVPLVADDDPNRQLYIDAKKKSGHLL